MLTFNFMILSLHHYVPMSISILISWRLELCDICTSKARFSNHYWVISKKQFGTSRDQLATCNKYVSLKKKKHLKSLLYFSSNSNFSYSFLCNHTAVNVSVCLSPSNFWMCLSTSNRFDREENCGESGLNF